MIPVSVLTGFLGSGKTTLLARLLRDPGMARTAVIINEFGAVGLDHELVEMCFHFLQGYRPIGNDVDEPSRVENLDM